MIASRQGDRRPAGLAKGAFGKAGEETTRAGDQDRWLVRHSVLGHSRGSLRITRAGFPPTSVNGSMSDVTNDAAATTAPRPIRTPLRIVLFAPIQTSSSISTGCEPTFRH